MTFSAPTAGGRALQRAWAGWLRLARRIAEVQGRVLLAILYVLLVVPVGLAVQLLSDPLRRRRPPATNWTPRAVARPTLEEARRQ